MANHSLIVHLELPHECFLLLVVLFEEHFFEQIPSIAGEYLVYYDRMVYLFYYHEALIRWGAHFC